MEINVNGESCQITPNVTVSQLVEKLNIPAGGTAIAVNGKIVKKDTWDSTHLAENDNVTVIRAAYGG